MRILIISNYFYPEIGAASKRVTNLATALAAMRHEVSVICPMPNYPRGKIFKPYKGKIYFKELIDGVRVKRLWIYPSHSKNFFKRTISMLSFAMSLLIFTRIFLKEIRETDWILIQSPPLFVAFSAVFLMKKILKKRIILNVSDLWPLSIYELYNLDRYSLLKKMLDYMELFNYRNSDAILGQSNIILSYIKKKVGDIPMFLYLNIPKRNIIDTKIQDALKRKNIIYAGLLGKFQGILDIIKNVDFKRLGTEFHIYGDGPEKEDIIKFLKEHPNRNVSYKGLVEPDILIKLLPYYKAALVPLVKNITGAIPSKLFELINLRIPIVFFGGGEGESLVKRYKIGYTAHPGDYKSLEASIFKLINLDDENYLNLIKNCEYASKKFNFQFQLRNLVKFIMEIRS